MFVVGLNQRRELPWYANLFCGCGGGARHSVRGVLGAVAGQPTAEALAYVQGPGNLRRLSDLQSREQPFGVAAIDCLPVLLREPRISVESVVSQFIGPQRGVA